MRRDQGIMVIGVGGTYVSFATRLSMAAFGHRLLNPKWPRWARITVGWLVPREWLVPVEAAVQSPISERRILVENEYTTVGLDT